MANLLARRINQTALFNERTSENNQVTLTPFRESLLELSKGPLLRVAAYLIDSELVNLSMSSHAAYDLLATHYSSLFQLSMRIGDRFKSEISQRIEKYVNLSGNDAHKLLDYYLNSESSFLEEIIFLSKKPLEYL